VAVICTQFVQDDPDRYHGGLSRALTHALAWPNRPPGAERPFDVDVPSQDVNSLGQLGPWKSTGGSNVESGSCTCDTGSRGVHSLDDVGVFEIAAGGFALPLRCQGQGAAAVRVE
jgi:hypothetical protein